MFKQFAGLLCVSILFSCQQNSKTIVECSVVENILHKYSSSLMLQTVDGNLLFWKKRMDSLPDHYVNASEYAAALVSHFRYHGNINDLAKADSIYGLVNKANQEKEPGILRTMAGLAMLQHRFSQTDSFVKKAVAIEGSTFPNAFLDFDVAFEAGNYQKAGRLLSSLQQGSEYGYLFRKSKYEHYGGSLDTSIACMKFAAEKAGSNIYLKQAALSNAADLYIHKGDLQKAYALYIQSLQADPADLHSITGLGWLALVHDKNDSLAEHIFRFVQSRTESLDILLKLVQLEEARGNTPGQKRYAIEFVNKVNTLRCERMYAKYLIDLYTGILYDPAKAVALSLQEISNRPSPQVFAWYAWGLFCNKEHEKAWSIYKAYVSGKPLEGPELYYMGKMMEGLKKEYNAKQFYKAAWKNRYDLSPAKQEELEKM
jgi:tetratricopeptide (TPR) repeat protein